MRVVRKTQIHIPLDQMRQYLRTYLRENAPVCFYTRDDVRNAFYQQWRHFQALLCYFKGSYLNQFVGLLLALVLHEFCTQLLQSKETPHKIDPLSSPATFRNFLFRRTLVLCPSENSPAQSPRSFDVSQPFIYRLDARFLEVSRALFFDTGPPIYIAQIES